MLFQSFNILAIAILFTACNKIETGSSLPAKDKEYIKSLGLLKDNEQINRFYSEYKNRVAGNFFTDKRIASYWIDERDSLKNQVNFAFYSDIIAIDTNYMAGALTYTPYLKVIKRDSTTFKVSVDGEFKEVKSFFEAVIDKWQTLHTLSK